MKYMIPETQIAFLTERVEKIIISISINMGFKPEFSDELLEASTEFFLRDIYRLDEQQRGSITLAKFAGYWAFWIRKLKPIRSAKFISGDLKGKKVADVNEVVALQLAVNLVLMLRKSGPFEDAVRNSCKDKTCDGTDCFEEYTGKYFAFNKSFFREYIMYSMRNRTFGPHHFSLLIENFVYSSCRKLNHDG